MSKDDLSGYGKPFTHNGITIAQYVKLNESFPSDVKQMVEGKVLDQAEYDRRFKEISDRNKQLKQSR